MDIDLSAHLVRVESSEASAEELSDAIKEAGYTQRLGSAWQPMSRPSRGLARGAELVSALGAALLGGGLALIFPTLQPQAGLLMAVGIAVHAIGMTLKHRVESQEADLALWERALYWSCLTILGMLALWLLYDLLP